jgi:geranylgeranyl reductase family protein
MLAYDVIVVGGGPAGSTCARKLKRAGLDVVVLDRARFPRDKVCAGWITPQVIAAAELDVDEYRRGRTFQPITGFRAGLIGRAHDIEVRYDEAVSFGIRRCEFDHYLLERSGARLDLGAEIAGLRYDGRAWIVNDRFIAPMLVGAGGHFCPVARRLNPNIAKAPVVVAQEAEFPIDDDDRGWTTAPETPELYFCRDLKGYGWCFRKQRYLNVGLGRLDPRSLPNATAQFVEFLRQRRSVPANRPLRWRGHAYLVSTPPRRRVSDNGVLLVGDAAGLAYPSSGEGIRPAVESGVMAAEAILAANGVYAHGNLQPYETKLRDRFELASEADEAPAWRQTLSAVVAPWLFDARWFVRRHLLDRCFLRREDPALPGIADTTLDHSFRQIQI